MTERSNKLKVTGSILKQGISTFINVQMCLPAAKTAQRSNWFLWENSKARHPLYRTFLNPFGLFQEFWLIVYFHIQFWRITVYYIRQLILKLLYTITLCGYIHNAAGESWHLMIFAKHQSRIYLQQLKV